MTWFGDFISLIFPNICLCCDKPLIANEKFICLGCIHDLPETGYISIKRNPVYNIFNGRFQIENAVSMLNFESGNSAQTIIHQLKYKGNPNIGIFMGELMGDQMKKVELYSSIDAIVPVPIHRSKLIQRGYNQSDYLAEGLSNSLGKALRKDLIKRKIKGESQTRKQRYDRWENVAQVFEFSGRKKLNINHILLIDDVITTGATIEACARCLSDNLDVKISVATLARSA